MSREENLQLVRRLHAGNRPMRELLRDVAADDLEWRVPGDPALLPWAGTWWGKDGLRRQTEVLRSRLSYDRFEIAEYIADEDEVVLITRAGGLAVGTNRRSQLETARVFTIREGKVARVRTYSDTGAYLAALYPDALEGLR